jgi:hypothetical protein
MYLYTVDVQLINLLRNFPHPFHPSISEGSYRIHGRRGTVDKLPHTFVENCFL